MFCTYCGIENPLGTQRCAQCGAQLSQLPPPEFQPVHFNNYQQPPFNTPYYAPATSQPDVSKDGFAIAGFVLGILSIICCYGSFLDFIFAGAAIAFSIAGRKGTKRNLATAGLICGIIGGVFALIIALMYLTGNFSYTFNGVSLFI